MRRRRDREFGNDRIGTKECSVSLGYAETITRSGAGVISKGKVPETVVADIDRISIFKIIRLNVNLSSSSVPKVNRIGRGSGYVRAVRDI